MADEAASFKIEILAMLFGSTSLMEAESPSIKTNGSEPAPEKVPTPRILIEAWSPPGRPDD